MRSFQFGVPTIIFPGAMFERRFNAKMVVRQNAGAFGELSDFRADWFESVFARRDELKKNAQRKMKR